MNFPTTTIRNKFTFLVQVLFLFIISIAPATIARSQATNNTFTALYDTFPTATKFVITKRRAQVAFTEAIQQTVFLSKASPYANKRWMTKSVFSDRKALMLDAYFNPYIDISNDRWTLASKKDAYWIFALFLTPNIEVRFFSDDASVGDVSEPIRTPSYRPGGELFFTKSTIYNTERNNNYAFSIKGYHHSNGQDGMQINPGNSPWGKKGYYNTYNGDFSDNLVLEFNGLSFMNRAKYSKYYFAKLGLSTSTATSKNMKVNHLYGTQRLNLLCSYKYAPAYYSSIYNRQTNRTDTISKGNIIEKFRVEFFLSFILNKMNVGSIYDLHPASIADRINCHTTIHCRVPGFSEVGLFAEVGYYGQDTYNVFFQRAALFYKLGLSFGHFLYPKKTDDLIHSN